MNWSAPPKMSPTPAVLMTTARTLRRSMRDSEAAKDFIVGLADHPSETVRREVIGALTSSWAVSTEGDH